MHLDEPLFPRGPNTRKLASLCALATLACERANRDATPSPFDGAAGLRLRDAFVRPCRGRDALETLREVGLLDLFPHLDGLAQCGEKHQQHRKRRSPGWDYFDRVAAVDRLRSCAARLAADARDPTRAKYLAHQLALVYQCVNAARGESKALKKRIEDRFEEVKNATEQPAGGGAGEGETGGALPREMAEWIEAIAREAEATALALPPGMTEKLGPVFKLIGG